MSTNRCNFFFLILKQNLDLDEVFFIPLLIMVKLLERFQNFNFFQKHMSSLNLFYNCKMNFSGIFFFFNKNISLFFIMNEKLE